MSSVLSKHFLVPGIPGFSAAKDVVAPASVDVEADIVAPASVDVEADVVAPASDGVEVARDVTVDVGDVPGNVDPVQDVVINVVEGSADTGDVLAVGSEAGTVPIDVVVEEVPDPEETDPGPGSSKPRWRKMSSAEEMSHRLDVAVKDFRDGNFHSIRECARFHRVGRTTLAKLVSDPQAEFSGYGKRSQVFTRQEEALISAHIKERMLQGCGLDILQVQCLMQDLLIAAIASNPARKSGWDQVDPESPWLQHLPTKSFVRNFLKRNQIVWRSSMPLNQGRAILNVQDLREWQDSTEAFLFSDPDLAEVMQDGSRIFNQDETPLCPGILSTFHIFMNL